MGTRMVPSYANCFMDVLETNFLDTQQLKPFTWWHFIDDIFLWFGLTVNQLFTPLFKNLILTTIQSNSLLNSRQNKSPFWIQGCTSKKTPSILTFIQNQPTHISISTLPAATPHIKKIHSLQSDPTPPLYLLT